MSAYEKTWKIKDKTELDLAVEYWAEQDPDTLGEEAAQELLDLRANLAEAVWLLKELEYSSVSQYDNDLPICPECFSTRTEGHEPSCDLAAFLKRMEAE